MVWCGSTNGHKNYMCYNDIELSAQILPPILGLIVNIIGGDLYDWLRRESLLIIMNKIFI